MKIEEIKSLKEFDVIAKATNDSKNQNLTYEIYYVLFNNIKHNKIEVCQGYYNHDKNEPVFFTFSIKAISYDELNINYYNLIHKDKIK